MDEWMDAAPIKRVCWAMVSRVHPRVSSVDREIEDNADITADLVEHGRGRLTDRDRFRVIAVCDARGHRVDQDCHSHDWPICRLNWF